MAGYQGVSWIPAANGGIPTYEFSEYPKNKYVFVKKGEKKALNPTILVNPHFKDNTKVYFNPKFSSSNNSVSTSIHINPNIVNPLISVVSSNNSFKKLPINESDDRSRILYSTKTKFIKLPEPKHDCVSTTNKKTTLTSISYKTSQHIPNSRTESMLPSNSYQTSKYKLNVSSNKSTILASNSFKTSTHNLNHMTMKSTMLPSSLLKTAQCIDKNTHKDNTHLSLNPFSALNNKPRIETNKKLLSTKTKIVNASIANHRTTNSSSRRTSINSRFKYISSSVIMKKMNKHTIRSKHKIVNNILNNSNKSNTKITRKKYVYVNKFNSSSFLANNVILKNRRYRNFININGILYKNTPCHLKKCVSNKTYRKSRILPFQTQKNEIESSEKTLSKARRISLIHKRKLSVGKYGSVRTQIPSSRSTKKSNLSCRIYKRFGKCPGLKNGTCIKIHNPEQIILCPRFLQGTCVRKDCLLSHKVSPEKMPTCKYFLEGLCSKDDCQYLHVKISPKADICRDFLEGFCRSGIKCEKRHQLLCPEFERTGKCPKRRCEYPHNYLKATLKKPIGRKLSKKYTEKKVISSSGNKEKDKNEKPKTRYYEEEMGNQEKSKENTGIKRPKLGSLPAFIPLNSDATEKTAE